MARWTGDDHVPAVLAATDEWRERCLLADASVFSDRTVWTAGNLHELKRRFTESPIEGGDLSFVDKLRVQLDGAPPTVAQLAAELLWLYFLFPRVDSIRCDTKRDQIAAVWALSDSPLPASSNLDDAALSGLGSPGTAYLARRADQIEFLLEVLEGWKSLDPDKRRTLFENNAPWDFIEWVDSFPNSRQRPVRNALLYYIYPDALERIVSNEHRRQIAESLKHRIPDQLRPKGTRPTLARIDRAIFEIRQTFEQELGTTQIDFYRPPLHAQWWISLRENFRKDIIASVKSLLSEYDLEVNQCGNKKPRLSDCKTVDTATGYWSDAGDATNKPLRWIIQFKLRDDEVDAMVPEYDGSRRIAYANTAQGKSGAVTIRIVPAIEVEDGEFVFYDTWEWLLILCFLPPLRHGSSGQLLEHFDESTGSLRYMGEEQPYIASALVALNEDEDVFLSERLPRQLSYGEATQALTRLLHSAPTSMRDTNPVTSED